MAANLYGLNFFATVTIDQQKSTAPGLIKIFFLLYGKINGIDVRLIVAIRPSRLFPIFQMYTLQLFSDFLS